jgi:hypothetical protein
MWLDDERDYILILGLSSDFKDLMGELGFP